MKQTEVLIDRREDVVVVAVDGDLDVIGAGALQRVMMQLSAEKPGVVIVDLSKVSLIASLAMGELMSCHHSLERRGGELRLAGASDLVSGALDRAKLLDQLKAYPSVDDALAA